MFIPSQVRISRAINVKAPASQLWEQIDDFRKWQNWNPFFIDLAKDSTTYLDSTNGKPKLMEVKGTIVEWKEVKEDERIAVMQKGNKQPLINGWKCIERQNADSTTLQWYMDFKLRWYPWEKFASLLFEKSYGVRMEEGLNNLKKIVTANRTSIN